MFYQVKYRVPGYFYALTAYDLETDDEEEIRKEIADQEGCGPEEVELWLETLESYRAG